MIQKIVLICLSLIVTTSVLAQTASSPSAQKMETLKDRLASAASQLQQSQRSALFGPVKTTSVSTITVETLTKDIKIELTDDITVIQYLKGKRTELTTDDIVKGDIVSVFGDFDQTLELMKAKLILIQGVLPQRLFGQITEIDKKGFTITVKTHENKIIVVDIETATKNNRWSKEDAIVKGAFSKYFVGDTVFVLGTANAKVQNRIRALRILDITPIVAPTPTATPVASPSATLKTTPKPTPIP